MRNWGGQKHVAQWPFFDLPKEVKYRPVWIWDNISRSAVDPFTGESIKFVDAASFIREITRRRLYIVVFRIKDGKSFAPLEELLDDKRCKPSGLSRTGGFFGLYIRSRYSAWIVEVGVWNDGIAPPDASFCEVLLNVWHINGRCAATPGSLGELKLRETLPYGTRFNRPSIPLRSTLLNNRAGGRADTIEEKKHYGILFEEDINSSYPAMSMETIDPSEHPLKFGNRRGISTVDNRFLASFFSYVAHCYWSIPSSSSSKRFGCLSVRDQKSHRLKWPTLADGQVYEGWYWKEEIDRARDAGYSVEITEGYGWKRSSDWMMQWAMEMYRLKTEFKGTPEGDIFKKESVGAIGRMGMAPEKLTLVDHYEKGDIPVSIKNANAEESPITKWFIHIEPNPDANNLTHIADYIVMKGRVALYDRILANENSGTEVVASNYDSLYTTTPPKLPHGKGLGDWKLHTIRNAYISAPRSISGIRDGTPIDKRPGVPRQGRKPVEYTLSDKIQPGESMADFLGRRMEERFRDLSRTTGHGISNIRIGSDLRDTS